MGIARSVDDAAAVIAEACQSGRVAPTDLLRALADRPRLRHRRSLRPILADVAAGSHSLLELRYLRDVERRHALPTGLRQRPVENEFTDVVYRGFGLVVELDGRLHLVPRSRWRDLDRDNRATLRAEATLRYGWLDVTGRPCQAAVQVFRYCAAPSRAWPPSPAARPARCVDGLRKIAAAPGWFVSENRETECWVVVRLSGWKRRLSRRW